MSTTNPEIIPLFGFNLAQEEALFKIRAARLAEHAFTGGERLGLRLSIDDPIRRVKAYFEPFWRINFGEEISARGYLIEDLIEVAIMQDPRSAYSGSNYAAQVNIEWGPRQAGSVSAFDFVAHHQMRDIPISVKSKDTGMPIEKIKPTTANLRQEERMLIEAGYVVGAEWHTYMASLGQLQARGPFVNTLTEEAVSAYLWEQKGVAEAFAHFFEIERRGRVVVDDPIWNDPTAWYNHFNLRTSSGAFQYTDLTANADFEARHAANMRARAEAKDAEREKDRAKEAIEKHVREQISLARRADPKARSVKAYGVDGSVATYTLTSNDQIRVTEKAAPESTVAA